MVFHVLFLSDLPVPNRQWAFLGWDQRGAVLGCGRRELLLRVSVGAEISGSWSSGRGDLFLGATTKAGKVFPSCHLGEQET